MSLNKNVNSGKSIIVGGSDKSKLFPVGYKFSMGGTIYTVQERLYESNTELRKLVTDSGDSEIVTVDTLIKDHKSPTGVTIIDKGSNENESNENDEVIDESENDS